MPHTTDDLIQDFEELGYDPAASAVYAHEYIADGKFTATLKDFAREMAERGAPGDGSFTYDLESAFQQGDARFYSIGAHSGGGKVFLEQTIPATAVPAKGKEKKIVAGTGSIYCPESSYCLIKCIEKASDMNGIEKQSGGAVEFCRGKYSPFGNATKNIFKDFIDMVAPPCPPEACPQKHNATCKKRGGLGAPGSALPCACPKAHSSECKERRDQARNLIPAIYRIESVEKGSPASLKWTPLDRHQTPTHKNVAIMLINAQEKNEYHAVLYIRCPENAEAARLGRVPKGDYPSAQQLAMIEIGDPTFECDTSPLKKVKLQKTEKYVYVYDIETYSLRAPRVSRQLKEGVAGGPTFEKLIPYCISILRLNIETGEHTAPVLFENSPGLAEGEHDCYEQMFDFLARAQEPEARGRIQVFAHNGGKFDNVFARCARNVKFLKNICSGATIKSLELVPVANPGLIIVLKDTLPFTLMSLKNLAKQVKATTQKLDFDIAAKPLSFYLDPANRSGWVEYVHTDTICLAECMVKMEQAYRKLNQSLTNNIGVPSIAWKTEWNMSLGLQEQYVPKSPSLVQLIRDSTYGGRVVHWMKEWKAEGAEGAEGDPLICLDGNSLYPSAMYLFRYPIGRPSLIPKECLGSGAEALERFQKEMIGDSRRMFIISCTVEIPNMQFPIYPVRSRLGTLIYPVGIVTGSYNSVDLAEMLKDGCVIRNISHGVYWAKSEKIFSNFVKKLYDERNRLKKEGNEMEYVWKIILNSSYGKFLESIDSFTKYVDEDFIKAHGLKEWQYLKLANGQYEYKGRLAHPTVRKPSHLGSFILGYSRKIMSNLIDGIGRENIAYGDTDSIYCRKSALSGIRENGDLGGFKNDYGEGKEIREAVFADYKRYYVEITSSTGAKEIKAKMNGANFNQARIRAGLGNPEGMEASLRQIMTIPQDALLKADTDMFKQFYRELNPNEPMVVIENKFSRCGMYIEIDEKQLQFLVNPGSRAAWKGGVYYPIGFDHQKPTVIISKKEPIIFDPKAEGGELLYKHVVAKSGVKILRTAHLLTNPELKRVVSYPYSKVESSIIANTDTGKLYMAVYKNSEERDIYRFNCYGPFEHVETINILAEGPGEIGSSAKMASIVAVPNSLVEEAKGASRAYDINEISVEDLRKLVWALNQVTHACQGVLAEKEQGAS